MPGDPKYAFGFLSKRNTCASCGTKFLMEKDGGKKGASIPHNSWRCASTCICQDCLLDMAKTVIEHQNKA